MFVPLAACDSLLPVTLAFACRDAGNSSHQMGVSPAMNLAQALSFVPTFNSVVNANKSLLGE